MQIHVALRQRGWSRRTRDVTCFGVLVDNFFSFFLSLYMGSSCAIARKPILTNKPNKQNTETCIQSYCINSSQILLNSKDTKCSSSLVQIRTQQFQDGGRPPFWKTVKLPYIRNRSADFEEIWQSDAYWPSIGTDR